MPTVNQYAIAQVLGSKMKPTVDSRFGGFGLLETTAGTIKARIQDDRTVGASDFTYEQDRVVVRAFEETREGASPDSLLWDTVLARRFAQRCRELGLDAPEAYLNRRLLNIRKNKSRYEKNGIRLSPTTRFEPHPSIVASHAHTIEFALVRLRYRYGVSIDDVLLDPALGDEFERLALEMAPQLSPRDLRLGALYIRKARFLEKNKRGRIDSLDINIFEQRCSAPVSLKNVSEASVPEESGLFELTEENRYLYISRNERLREAVHEFISGTAFAVVSNDFWKPDPKRILLRFVPGDKIANVSFVEWEKRLIVARRPIFNWPINSRAA